MVARPANASLQNVAHAQVSPYLLRVNGLVLIGERGIARDYETALDPRQIGRQVFGNPVREVLLLPIVAEIGKGQHDNRQSRRDDGLYDRGGGWGFRGFRWPK